MEQSKKKGCVVSAPVFYLFFTVYSILLIVTGFVLGDLTNG